MKCSFCGVQVSWSGLHTVIPCLFCALSKKLKSLKSERKELGHKGPRGSEDCVDKMPFALKVPYKQKTKEPGAQACLQVHSLFFSSFLVFKWMTLSCSLLFLCSSGWLSLVLFVLLAHSSSSPRPYFLFFCALFMLLALQVTENKRQRNLGHKLFSYQVVFLFFIFVLLAQVA